MPNLALQIPSFAIALLPGVGAVQYHECKGSPQESYTNQTFAIKRIFDTLWQDRWRFSVGILGDAARVDTGTTDETGKVYGVIRSLPDLYSAMNDSVPGFSALPVCMATGIESIEGLGVQSQGDQSKSTILGSNYDLARISVRYDAPSFPLIPDNEMPDILTEIDRTLTSAYYTIVGGQRVDYGFNEGTLLRYVTRITQPTAEALTLPNGAFRFVDGFVSPNGATGSIVPSTNVKIVPTTEVHYTWHMVPGVPIAIPRMIGTVNKYYFDEWQPGTLLLTAVEVKPYRWGSGRRLCDITYKMKHFSAIDPSTNLPYSPHRGHNYFLNQYATGGPAYQLITKEGVDSVNRVYREKDYNLLFNPNGSISPNVLDDNLGG